MPQARGRGATESRGSVDPHFFEYAVHMWHLTPLRFVSYSDFDPTFCYPPRLGFKPTVLYTDVDGQCDKLMTDYRHQFITLAVHLIS